MPTTVTHSIGATNTPTTMDYSTLALWAAACPADLVSADQVWLGEVYNQGEMDLGGSALSLTATSDATRKVVLRAATGAGFKNHANAATNPLRYNETVGAAIKGAVGYGYLATISAAFETYGLQWRQSAGSGQGDIWCNSPVFLVHETIASIANNGLPNGIIHASSASPTNVVFTNVLGIDEGATHGIFALVGGGTCVNCTAACLNAGAASVTGKGFLANYGAVVLTNCAAFDLSTGAIFDTQSNAISGAKNASNQATFAGTSGTNTLSGSVSNVAWSTATFASVSGVTHGSGTGFDLRTVSGSGLNAAGTNSGAPATDILGTARANPPTIGAFEFVTVDQSVAPGAGSIVLTGLAPATTINTTVAPGAGSLAFTGLAPTLTANASVAPGVGSIVFTGLAPSLIYGTVVSPGAGSITFTGLAPTATAGTAAVSSMTWTEAVAALRAFITAQWALTGLAADMPLAWQNETVEYSESFLAVEIEGLWAEKSLYGGSGKRSSVQGGIVFLHAFVPTGSGHAAATNAIDVLTQAIELQTISSLINLEGGAPPSPVAYGDVDHEIPGGQPGGNFYRCSGSVPFILIGTV